MKSSSDTSTPVTDRWYFWVFLALLVAFAVMRFVSCRPRVVLGAVTGKVTYRNQPLKTQGATVAFLSSETRTFVQIPIKEDGTFRAQVQHGWGLPPGTYKVAIMPPISQQAKFPDIPSKYRDPDKSGLVLDLTKEGTEFSINMEP